ncbi:hypothetical protein ACFQ1Q_12765 [Winogradskyella litorisediminis]|uniref:FixH protein n=1 Tax=Winogradskyella litorisediminis TaxID=1156618 RepID=A0ABW3N9B5_9FLAO
MKKLKPILTIFVLATGFFFVFGFINSLFGWYGYEKWKYRRATRGNLDESLERNVFIKNLEFELFSNSESLKFNAFIEKGFTYGKHSSETTEIIKSRTNYPYQVSFSQMDISKKVKFDLLPNTKLDSIDYFVVYLRKPELKDTLFLKITKWENEIGKDSIGLIKIYDKYNIQSD